MSHLIRQNKEFFAWLRTLSDSPPPLDSAAALITHELRLRIRAPLLRFLKATSEVLGRWNGQQRNPSLRYWGEGGRARTYSACDLKALLKVRENVFFFNLGRMHFWTWLSAMYQVDLEGNLEDEIGEIQEDLAYLRNYRDPIVVPPKDRPPSRFGKGREVYTCYLQEANYHTSRLAHHPADMVAMELLPAMNITAGLVRLAWLRFPDDAERRARIVKNSSPLILEWSTLNTVAFSEVRLALIDPRTALMLDSALTLENEGQADEQFVMTEETMQKIRDNVRLKRASDFSYRRNCLGLQVKGSNGRGNAVEELLIAVSNSCSQYQNRIWR